jgi:hypothetical protein
MGRWLAFLGMTVGGWIGWVVGGWVSGSAAFLASIVGTGLGLYAAREIVDRHF